MKQREKVKQNVTDVTFELFLWHFSPHYCFLKSAVLLLKLFDFGICCSTFNPFIKMSNIFIS